MSELFEVDCFVTALISTGSPEGVEQVEEEEEKEEEVEEEQEEEKTVVRGK